MNLKVTQKVGDIFENSDPIVIHFNISWGCVSFLWSLPNIKFVRTVGTESNLSQFFYHCFNAVPPEFSPPLPSVIEGQRMGDLTINCAVTGKPPPKVQWMRGGSHLTNDTFREVSNWLLSKPFFVTRFTGREGRYPVDYQDGVCHFLLVLWQQTHRLGGACGSQPPQPPL